ncbi:hypothetical protein JOL62DRAFT_2120 [Phyllosticta paracitricarpa]|uniref:Uncharacterized protein n=1 Tax=Phyllosticta paracitricarpa TaxID=2016321 RepID=A0ABR1NJL6_9PEZI
MRQFRNLRLNPICGRASIHAPSIRSKIFHFAFAVFQGCCAALRCVALPVQPLVVRHGKTGQDRTGQDGQGRALTNQPTNHSTNHPTNHAPNPLIHPSQPGNNARARITEPASQATKEPFPPSLSRRRDTVFGARARAQQLNTLPFSSLPFPSLPFAPHFNPSILQRTQPGQVKSTHARRRLRSQPAHWPHPSIHPTIHPSIHPTKRGSGANEGMQRCGGWGFPILRTMAFCQLPCKIHACWLGVWSLHMTRLDST